MIIVHLVILILCLRMLNIKLKVEDLFYNTPTRLSALRSSTEEYARILDVVTKYAVHNPHVAFSCKKVTFRCSIPPQKALFQQSTTNAPDLTSPSSSTTSQAIGLLYGQHITKHLLTITCSSPASDKSDNDPEAWTAEALFTGADYQANKMVFLLFINRE